MRTDINEKSAIKPASKKARPTRYKSVLKMHKSVSFLLVFYLIVALGLLVALTLLSGPTGFLYNLGDSVADTVRAVVAFLDSSTEQ